MKALARLGPVAMGAALAVAGIALIRSATGMGADPATAGFAKSQWVWLAVALPCGLAVAAAPFGWIERRADLGYALAIGGLALVLVAGESVNGARSWFRLGPVRVQPVELAKLALVLALAQALGRAARPPERLAALAPVAALVGLPLLLILAQPDLGSAAVMAAPLLAMLVVAGAPLGRLAAIAAALGATLPGAHLLGLLKPHQVERLRTFVDPERDPRGAGFQAIQAKLAVGGGELWGQGYGAGTQTQLGMLPDRHTDFIFAVGCEEGGLVLGAAILAFYLAILIAALLVAAKARDPVARLTAVGVGALLAGQAAMNTGVALGALPVTGVTLPFVSYGGSSLVASFVALGLLGSAAAARGPLFADDPLAHADGSSAPSPTHDRAAGFRLRRPARRG